MENKADTDQNESIDRNTLYTYEQIDSTIKMGACRQINHQIEQTNFDLEMSNDKIWSTTHQKPPKLPNSRNILIKDEVPDSD